MRHEEKANAAVGLHEKSTTTADILAEPETWRDGDVVSASLRGVAEDIEVLNLAIEHAGGNLEEGIISNQLHSIQLRVVRALALHERIVDRLVEDARDARDVATPAK